MDAIHALWTFPAIILVAILIAWVADYVYTGWSALETVKLFGRRHQRNAFTVFKKLAKEKLFHSCS